MKKSKKKVRRNDKTYNLLSFLSFLRSSFLSFRIFLSISRANFPSEPEIDESELV
jgi:hypothetical protein